MAAIDGAAVLAMLYLSSDHKEVGTSEIPAVVVVVTAVALNASRRVLAAMQSSGRRALAHAATAARCIGHEFSHILMAICD